MRVFLFRFRCWRIQDGMERPKICVFFYTSSVIFVQELISQSIFSTCLMTSPTTVTKYDSAEI